ncbi:hypothetical protein K501DRAFT_332365 [Backusella circina FSU 941]|nr:hypothetical protein K501DRAFT_332365 [Backusella circina FSU 941]
MQRHARLLDHYSKLQDDIKEAKDKERDRKRAVLLSLNKNKTPFTWPRVFNYGISSASFLSNNSIYTIPKRKTMFRPKKRSRLLAKARWDSELPGTINQRTQFDYLKNKTVEDAKDQVLEHALDSVIEDIKSNDDYDDSQGSDPLAVRHLSIDMLERLFQNMANTYVEDKTSNYDWEYVLGKAIETGLPALVIERVRQRMTNMTKKETQAINALNIPKSDQFVDLTEPTSEAEVKRIVMDISARKHYPWVEDEETNEQELDVFEHYLELTHDSENLTKRVQSIHDHYNQEVLKTESRYEFEK